MPRKLTIGALGACVFALVLAPLPASAVILSFEGFVIDPASTFGLDVNDPVTGMVSYDDGTGANAMLSVNAGGESWTAQGVSGQVLTNSPNPNFFSIEGVGPAFGESTASGPTASGVDLGFVTVSFTDTGSLLPLNSIPDFSTLQSLIGPGSRGGAFYCTAGGGIACGVNPAASFLFELTAITDKTALLPLPASGLLLLTGLGALARASASASTTTTARAAACASPSAPAAPSRWCRR